jgi:hypothetical protein
MQALMLRQRVGCSEADRKSWERAGVLIALRPGAGAGIHAQYDDANVLAAAIALGMKRMGVTASRYATAFSELHAWLRGHSSLDWPRYRVFLTPERAQFQRAVEPIAEELTGFTVDLGPLCVRLFGDERAFNPQMPLPFALGTVR